MKLPEDWKDGATIEIDGRPWLCMFSPQFGGYRAKMIASAKPVDVSAEGPCVGSCEVVIWHDGEFPYDDGEGREFHLCDVQQFADVATKIVAAHQAALAVEIKTSS